MSERLEDSPAKGDGAQIAHRQAARIGQLSEQTSSMG